jgi:N6-L-threonylcarbamoyladenine synthase
VAAFDIQKIKDPSISGSDYQNGPQKDFANVREYVLYRDGHKCIHCRGKSKDKRLEVHHLLSRQTAGDRPDILATLCFTCHEMVSQGKLLLHIKPSKGFKAETFMSTVRWMIVDSLRAFGYAVSHTYGYFTKVARHQISLAKSHINGAFVIAGGTIQRRSGRSYLLQQVRKSNRKLFKRDRSHIKNAASRFISGFQRFDKVMWRGIECFIFGRRSSGYFDLRKLDGTKIHASAKATEISLLERAQSFLIERKSGYTLCQEHSVSAA